MVHFSADQGLGMASHVLSYPPCSSYSSLSGFDKSPTLSVQLPRCLSLDRTRILQTNTSMALHFSAEHFCDKLGSSFLGSRLSLSFSPAPFPHHRRFNPCITAIIKRRKDSTLDNIIQRQKKLKLVSKIKELLVKQPGMVMSLKKLGMYRRQLGLQGKRRVISLLKKYPAVFEIFEEGVSTLYFRLTPEAEDQFMEEEKLRDELESALVTKIRKLLMMSIDKRLLVRKIAHLRRDLGLPDDFRNDLLDKYPQYFKIVELEGGTALELTAWDPALAISAWEKKMQQTDSEESAPETISGRPRKYYRIDLPRGFNLKRKDKEVIRRFQDMSYVSPYADFSTLNPSSREAEKHACGVVHELLSLTLEKRTLIDHLTHFRKDYKFSQRVHGMLIRHPETFYVSLKGDRDSVFLREAYNGAELIQKDPLVSAKEKLGRLVALSAKYNTHNGGDDDDDDEEEEDESDGADGDDDDDWSDDESDSDLPVQKGPKLISPRNAPIRREVRRPIEVIEREKALALQSSIPRERW